MIDNNKTYLQIEDYLNNRLSYKENIAFEKEMNLNPKLQELVNDYQLVNEIIIQAEISSIKEKLTTIHKNKIRNKRIKLASIILLVILIAGGIFFYINKEENQVAKVIKPTEKSNTSLPFINEPSPLTLINSVEKEKLFTPIKASKSQATNSSITDTVKKIELEKVKPFEITSNKTTNLSTANATTPTNNPTHLDSLTKESCKIELSLNNVIITPSCDEKETGSILFLLSNKEYEFSINNGKNFSTNVDFTYLSPSHYSLKIKEKTTQCTSNELTIILDGQKCNYIIHPDRFEYFELSLGKFNESPKVEVFIFDKNGTLIFNQFFLTTENFIWKGETSSNNPVPLGNYSYLIKSDKKTAKGEISVIR